MHKLDEPNGLTKTSSIFICVFLTLKMILCNKAIYEDIIIL